LADAVHPVPEDFSARIGPGELAELEQLATSVPDRFWLDQARRLTWDQFPTKAGDWSFNEDDFRIEWFADGELNLSVNCLDRHLANDGNRTALIFEADEPGTGRTISYRELYQETCRFANLLRSRGVKRGDRVMIYMPMIPEAAAAMLACARIGAVHSVVFGGFSPESLAGRIADCDACAVITADEGVRGGKVIPLKRNVDEALETRDVPTVVVVTRTGAGVPMKSGRDIRYSDVRERLETDCTPEVMKAEDPLFILYTSGSTGKPKGVVHTTGGYATWVATTFDWVFGAQDDDIFWCTADIGWITGHSYVVYGPLAMRATSVMFDGVPNYPDFGRFWETIDRLGVTIFYTAPTAIRALEREGDEWVKRHSRKSLRLLGTVGEPINPDAWDWYWRVVGDGRCPVVDTWWQTETGGILISPLPGATDLKPGSATKPLPGIAPLLVDANHQVLEGAASGNLCIAASWPGQMRTVWGDHARFFETYFKTYPGLYFTGDGCRRDDDGYYWITGRVDDVINVSGHRVGSAEVESSLVSHPKVAEAAVVGYPHDIKGQAIYAFVTLNAGEEGGEEVRRELIQEVRHDIGAFSAPEKIHFTPSLPKTRSGKIMRRILRKIAEGATDGFGDISTLADPTIVDALLKGRAN
jgi:acetyl-CoA synthetase